MKWLQNLTCIVARLRHLLSRYLFSKEGCSIQDIWASTQSKHARCPADHKSSGGEMRLKSEEEEEEEEEEIEEEEEEKEEEEEDKTM